MAFDVLEQKSLVRPLELLSYAGELMIKIYLAFHVSDHSCFVQSSQCFAEVHVFSLPQMIPVRGDRPHDERIAVRFTLMISLAQSNL